MKILTVLSLAAFLVPAAACADGGRVSLKEAITLALERNHLLKAASFERTAAEREVAVSRSRYFPRLRLDETLSASNSPTSVFMMKLNQGRFSDGDFAIDNLNHPSSHGDFQTTLTIEQPLLDFSIARGAELADKEDTARGLALEWRRQETAFTVYGAYLEVQKRQAFLGVAEQAVADAREHERLAGVRGEAGVGLRSDQLRARTFLAEMEQQLISARNDRLLAMLRLAQATGGKPGESLEIGDELRAPAVTPGSAELAQLALENRQDLKGVALAVDKAEVGVRQARQAYLPTVHASAAYQMNDRDIPFGRDNDAWTAGVSLRWELFDGMRRGNELARARATRSAADEYRENYRSEVLLQVTEYSLRRDEAAQRLAVARQALLDAEEGVRLVARRFENSLATMVELLDAETALNRSRALLVENESDYALATARLYLAAGIFLKEVMR
ncbi:MAG: TolC family protein [Geobacteraceae bacterium]|nr:TolC family protein [Geobacteraceae bacterium]